MSDPRFSRAALLALIEGNQSLYDQLREAGFLPAGEDAIGPEHLETARVAYTLTRELEVNWEGTEIVLRMRSELIASRRQVAELLALLNKKA
ncbi:MAG: hypothetical protein QM778_16140 [Myxococcales bacterium]